MSTETPTPWTFNWHDEEGTDSFLEWLVPTVLVGMAEGADDAVEAASDDFTNVKLTMQINGIEVNAQEFIKGVEYNMNHFAELEAQRLVRDATDLVEITDVLESAREAVTRTLLDQLKAAGVYIREED